MKTREKFIISIVALIFSIILFAYIFLEAFDLSDIRIRLFGNQVMSLLKANNYEELYNLLPENYDQTLEEFSDQGLLINNITGDIRNFKIYEIKQNEDYVNLSFDTTFANFNNSKIKTSWSIINDGGLKVSNYSVQIKPDLILESHKNKDIAIEKKYLKFCEDIISDYKDGKYELIYENNKNRLGEIGSREDFYKYLSSIKTEYGDINSYKLLAYNFDKTQKELKVTYDLLSNNDHKLLLILWVDIKDELSISGIKFVKNNW